jgi:hypothetical protein
MERIDFDSVNQTALQHLPDFLPELLPGGFQKGREFVCGDLAGHPGKSLSVNLDNGKWSDFATEEKGGDPVSLVAAIRGVSQGEAARALMERLGITGAPITKAAPVRMVPTNTWKTTSAEKPPSSIKHPGHGAPSMTWEYHDQDGSLLGIVCRFEQGNGKKEIVPFTYGTDTATGETGWRWRSWPAPRPLYGLDRLKKCPNAPVLVTEGEKACDAAQGLLPTVVCITWPGGSSVVRKADWSPLKGRRVAIWPDADEPGHKAALAAADAALQAGAAEVSIIAIPEGKFQGWDLADALSEDWTSEKVTEWVKGHRNRILPQTTTGETGEEGENVSRVAKSAGLRKGEPRLTLDEKELAALLSEARARLSIDSASGGITYPVEALGPLAAACKTLSKEGQVPVEMAGQCLLTTAALLAQSRADVRTLGGIKPLSLYGLTVAESGEGKSTADDAAQYPVTEWQRAAAKEYRSAMHQFEAEKAARRKNDSMPEAPSEPYRIMRDGTVEGIRRSFKQGSPSQGVFSSEAAVMLAGYGMSPDHRAKSAGNFNALWDNGEISVARGLDGRLQLYDRRLSLHWLVQADVAYTAIHDPLLSSIGFWPRFLLACPPQSPPLKARPFEPSQHPDIRELWAICSEMLAEPLGEDCSRLPVITPTPEAEQLACRFYEAMQTAAKKEGGLLVDVKPFAVRATEQAFRVAGVLAVFAGLPKIDAEMMRNGISISSYSLETWRSVFGHRDEQAARAWAFSLYGWTLRQPRQQSTRSSVLQIGPKALRSKDRRDTAIALLQQAGLVKCDPHSITVIGGR